jgi:hypothetical protein
MSCVRQSQRSNHLKCDQYYNSTQNDDLRPEAPCGKMYEQLPVRVGIIPLYVAQNIIYLLFEHQP